MGSARGLWHDTDVSGPRWLAALLLAFAVIFAGAAPASAQVFKPRGGSKAKAGGGGAKKATPKARGGGSAKRTTAKASTKKKVASKSKTDADKDNVAEEDDYVEIIDDDE